MIYIVFFSISIILVFFANRTKKNTMFWILTVLSALLMILLAGLRAYSVGIDAMNYYKMDRYWAGAIRAESFLDYLKYYIDQGYREPLFAVFLGGVARICGNFSVFLLLAHTVIISGIYIGAFRYRAYVDPTWVLLFFFFFFYIHSLNVIRQYMAMALVMAVFADIYEKKWARYCIVVASSALIHTSALLAVIPLLIYIVLYSDNKLLGSRVWVRWGLVIGAALLSLCLLIPVVRLCMNLGLLDEKYIFYLESDIIKPALMDSLFVGAGLCVVFLFYKKIQLSFDHFSFFVLNSVVYLILLQFSWFIIYGKRIAGFQMFPYLITIALIEKAQTNKLMKLLVRVGIVFVGLVYFVYTYVLRNASEGMPYSFVFMQ